MTLRALGRRLAFAFLFCCASVASRPTQAQKPAAGPVSLQWVRGAGAESCADGRELARRVEAKLGRAVFGTPASASLLIEGQVTHQGHGFTATLRSFDAQNAALGARDVRSARADCEELSETVAVVLAIMIDPEAAMGGAPAAPVPEPEPSSEAPCACAPSEPAAPEAAPDGPQDPPPPQEAKAREPSRAVSAFARVAWGHAPTAIWGAGVALELGLRRFGGVRLEAAAFAEREVELTEVANAGSRVRVLYAGAQFCPLWGASPRLFGALCAGAAAGALQARSYGLENAPKDTLNPLFNLTLSGRASVRLAGPVHLFAGATVGAAMLRTLFEAELRDGTQVELFEQGAFTVEGDLGLGGRF